MYKWLILLTIANTISVLLIAALTLLVSYLKDLGTDVRRFKLLDEETKRVDYWQKLNDSRAAREIERSADIVEETYRFREMPGTWEPQRYRQYLKRVPTWRRALLLYAPFSYALAGLKRIWLVLFVELCSVPFLDKIPSHHFARQPLYLSRIAAFHEAAILHFLSEHLGFGLFVLVVLCRFTIEKFQKATLRIVENQRLALSRTP